MRGIFVIIFLSLLIISFIYIGKGSKEKDSPIQMINKLDKAKGILINTQVNQIVQALNSYYMDKNEYPEMLDLLVPNYSKSEENIKDMWGTKFQLKIDESMRLDLISAGPDRTFGTKDDIKRSI